MDEREINRAMSTFAISVDAMISMEGMKAENIACQEKGQEIIYTQEQFDVLQQQMQNKIAQLY